MAAKQGDKSLRDMDKEGSSMFGGLPYLFAHLPIIHHLPTNSLPLHPPSFTEALVWTWSCVIGREVEEDTVLSTHHPSMYPPSC